jgi:hypothetical protein
MEVQLTTGVTSERHRLIASSFFFFLFLSFFSLREHPFLSKEVPRINTVLRTYPYLSGACSSALAHRAHLQFPAFHHSMGDDEAAMETKKESRLEAFFFIDQ